MEVTGPPSHLEEQRPQGLGSLGRNLAGLGYGFTCERGWLPGGGCGCTAPQCAHHWWLWTGTPRRLGGESHKCGFSSQGTFPVQAPQSWKEGSLCPGGQSSPQEPAAV